MRAAEKSAKFKIQKMKFVGNEISKSHIDNKNFITNRGESKTHFFE